MPIPRFKEWAFFMSMNEHRLTKELRMKTLTINHKAVREGIIQTLVIFTLLLVGATTVDSKESIRFKDVLQAEMKMPVDVAVSQMGNIFVLDQKKSQVHVFNAGSEYLYSFSEYGSGPGKLMNPQSIAISRAGDVIVADTGNNRVQVFSDKGKFMYELGNSGSEPGEFSHPTNVAVDQYGYIFVMDTGNENVSKFSPNGVFYESLPLDGEPQDMAFDVQQNLYVLYADDGRIIKWSMDYGDSEIIEFNWEGRDFVSEAASLSVDMRGDIYLIDNDKSRIIKMDQDQNILLSFGSKGSGKGQFEKPMGIVADNSGKVYIADSRNKRVQIIEVNGSYKPMMAATVSQAPIVDYAESIPVEKSIVDLTYSPNYGLYALSEESGKIIHQGMNAQFTYGEFEDRDLKFSAPQALAVRVDGAMLVADTGNHRLQFVNPDGTHDYFFGTRGSDDGQFDSLGGVAVRDDGFIYISDTKNNRIQVFNNDGIYLDSFGTHGESGKNGSAELGWFHHPKTLKFDSTGMLYVLDSRNKRIQVFDRSGSPVKEIGSADSKIQLEQPVDIAIDERDYLYIADRGAHKVKVLDPYGELVTEFGSAGKGRSYFPKLSSVSASQGKIYVADYDLDEIKVFHLNSAGNWPTPKAPVPQVAAIPDDVEMDVHVKMHQEEIKRMEAENAKKKWFSFNANEAQAMPEKPLADISDKNTSAKNIKMSEPPKVNKTEAKDANVQDPKRIYFTQVSYPMKTDNMDPKVKIQMTRKMTMQLVIANVAKKYGMEMEDVQKLIQIEKEDLLDDGRMKITVSIPKKMKI